MISVTEAKELITENIRPLMPVNLPLDKLSGHVLAKDIHASYDIPAFRQSSMDGYAFQFDEEQKQLILVGEMAAGTSQPITVLAGETSRIFTGAPLPEGADTVVMQEKVQRSGQFITLQDPQLSRGINVRAVGSEIKSSALAMQQGDLAVPAAIGFLAGIGVTHATAFPMPRVAIILTGNELQQPGSTLEYGKVYESNSYSLSAALKKEGINEINLYWATDDLVQLSGALQDALKKNDVILLTGGVSVGDYDFVLKASEQCGVTQIFHKVKQKPGKPLFFGKKEQKVIFGLPGNPSSVLSCYYNYVQPALRGLSSKTNTSDIMDAQLTADYRKPLGITHFLKGHYQDGKVSPLGAQESYRLSTFALSNCLIILDEDKEIFTRGQTISILLIP